MPLTDTALKSAKPSEKPYKLPDGDGLYLDVSPTGRKVWRYDFRFAGKRQTLTYGPYPDIPLASRVSASKTLKGARQLHREARELLAAGVNPCQAKKTAKRSAEDATANSFEALAWAWFNAQSKEWSQSYIASVMRILKTDVLPYIGSAPITSIKARDLIEVFKRMKNRGVHETARRARVMCGQVFRYAIQNDLAENDPTLALKGERRAKAKRHHAAFTEPADIARLMTAIKHYRGSPEVRAGLALSAYLFQRPGEIRTMDWRDIDIDAAEWRFTASKTKTPHLVPLPTQALVILREMKQLTGVPMSARPDAPHYVLPSPKTRLRPLSENGVRQALRTLGFTNDEMTAHGFRAMARSVLAEKGWNTDAIERQLAHKVAGPLGASYDRAQFLSERRRMMQFWADYLDAQVSAAPRDA